MGLGDLVSSATGHVDPRSGHSLFPVGFHTLTVLCVSGGALECYMRQRPYPSAETDE